ncbi:hypothetical protein AB0J55_10865 [Amycolatopsis sp. NPDC049688]|uniref:hypothetical protein n=1 Tax=Amycolatopsis sp. NPDC049688 TaxID=3154733 RepID=UPI0034468246
MAVLLMKGRIPGLAGDVVRGLVGDVVLPGSEGLPILRRNLGIPRIPRPFTGITGPGFRGAGPIGHGDGRTGVTKLGVLSGHLPAIVGTGGVIGAEGIDIALAVSLPPGDFGGVRIPPMSGENIPNIINTKFRRLSRNRLDRVLGGPKGIHLGPHGGLSIPKMNSIISGGLNKGKGGIGSSIPGAPPPPGHGLGPESTDPLSPFNHPVGQLAGTHLRSIQ